MEDLFEPLGYLENRIEKYVLNKNKQLTLEQYFKMSDGKFSNKCGYCSAFLMKHINIY